MTDHPRRVTRALLSVSDKSGLIEFARALAGHGIDLVSTGGTAKAVAAAGREVTGGSELTGLPATRDGGVRALTPRATGGGVGSRGGVADGNTGRPRKGGQRVGRHRGRAGARDGLLTVPRK